MQKKLEMRKSILKPVLFP